MEKKKNFSAKLKCPRKFLGGQDKDGNQECLTYIPNPF